MYEITDTIAAISSPAQTSKKSGLSVIRISGPESFAAADLLFSPTADKKGITKTYTTVEGLRLPAYLYCFCGPFSYTGQDIVEIHAFWARPVVKAFIQNLFDNYNCRSAQGGEFTLRAYLNGRMDLSQAEAVASIVAGSNRIQLCAAQKLLSGELSKTIARINSETLELLGLLEAGLDFCDEQIEFITESEAVTRLEKIIGRLKALLNNSIYNEELIDFASVVLAGPTNAGKSTLFNALAGKDRAITSDVTATTRDLITEVLELDNSVCTISDCAGLLTKAETEIDRLAQSAAIEAVNNAQLVLFCVDITERDLSQARYCRELIKNANVSFIAAKSDLLDGREQEFQINALNKEFGDIFFSVSVRDNNSVEKLKALIDSKICETVLKGEMKDRIEITARHKRALLNASSAFTEAIEEIKARNTETAAMYLRNARVELAGVENEHIDEKVLQQIFSQFCIGK